MAIMNTIPASEIKRRGVAAIDEALKKNPIIHIIRNNRPAYVVLSENDYAALLNQTHFPSVTSLWDLLDQREHRGTRSKASIDSQVKKERSEWDDE